MSLGYRVAVVGATGLVGQTMLKVLEERQFPVDELGVFASGRSAGAKIVFNGKEHNIEALDEHAFDRGFDFVLFGVDAQFSAVYAPIAAARGAVAIDNSSHFRMNDDVPLVVPEVNPDAAFTHEGIIANPNCSTIQAVVALKPLYDLFGIKRVVYSTYQAVSGAGLNGIEDLARGLRGEEPRQFDYKIAGNLIPQIDAFLDNGYTKEEWKMIVETQKIMGDSTMMITATTVRVPVTHGHSESINVEFDRPFKIEQIYEALENAPGIVVMDNPSEKLYPMPMTAADTDLVYVGRVRRDFSVNNGLNLWVVADNVRKGAATNAVQIAELLISRNA